MQNRILITRFVQRAAVALGAAALPALRKSMSRR